MRTLVCFEKHAADGTVWAVKHRNRWHLAKALAIRVPMETRYQPGRQPVAYFYTDEPVRLSRTREGLILRHVL